MTQCDLLLKALKRGPITPLEALNHYGIMRLAARAYDLKMCGYDIRTRIVCARDRYGDAVRVAEYSLGQQP